MKQTIKFDDLVSQYIGKPGSKKRDQYETEFKANMIGELIKQARTGLKLTQQDLADKLNINKSNVSRMENGATDIRISTMLRMFDLLGIKITFDFEVKGDS